MFAADAVTDAITLDSFLVLTVISFITAVLGVFAVIYVAVNSRRMEEARGEAEDQRQQVSS